MSVNEYVFATQYSVIFIIMQFCNLKIFVRLLQELSDVRPTPLRNVMPTQLHHMVPTMFRNVASTHSHNVAATHLHDNGLHR